MLCRGATLAREGEAIAVNRMAFFVAWVLTHANFPLAHRVSPSSGSLPGLAQMNADLAWVKTHATVEGATPQTCSQQWGEAPAEPRAGNNALLPQRLSSGFALPKVPSLFNQ